MPLSAQSSLVTRQARSQVFGMGVKQCAQISVFLILNFSGEESFYKKKMFPVPVSVGGAWAGEHTQSRLSWFEAGGEVRNSPLPELALKKNSKCISNPGKDRRDENVCGERWVGRAVETEEGQGLSSMEEKGALRPRPPPSQTCERK